MKKKFYITTTLPYVNADPHIGFAMELIRADALARYHRLLGEEILFNTGVDEHGQKIYQKALENQPDPQQYVDQYAEKYRRLKKPLNVSYTHFIRTTDPHHIQAAQEFWRRCDKNGDIYKAQYQIKYCVGCELEKTDSELVDGRCPIHPNKELQINNEENYFFRWSKYQQPLLNLYRKNPDFVVPRFRLDEITKFVKSGLKDFSISRLKTKMPWGIDVPGDPEQVMYVWFDALINYISVLGWPENKKNFNQFWPGVQIAGKDNLRQQSAMWQAMLLSAGLPPSKQIYIEGFITVNGQKISKSLGNVINPLILAKQYGTDPLRYYLLREIPAFSDGDFSESRFVELYNADLANGLGNLVARVITLADKYFGGKVPTGAKNPFDKPHIPLIQAELKNDKEYHDAFSRFDIGAAINSTWEFISACDQYVGEQKPWELAKNKDPRLTQVVYSLLECLHQITWKLLPIMPGSALEIAHRLNLKTILKEGPVFKDDFMLIPPGNKITVGSPLFPRLEKLALFNNSRISKNPENSIVVGKITNISTHPKSEKLKVATVEIGKEAPLTIVCGGPNIKKGQIVPVALPGSEINQPEEKRIKVKKTNIRGIKSEGVICSKLEVGTGDEYEKIWILPESLEKNLGQPLPKC